MATSPIMASTAARTCKIVAGSTCLAGSPRGFGPRDYEEGMRMTRVLMLTIALFAPMVLEGCWPWPGEAEPTAEEIAAAEKAREREDARIEYAGRFEQYMSDGPLIIDFRAEGPRHEVLALVGPRVGQQIVDIFKEGGERIEEIKAYGFETIRFEDSDTKQEWVLVLSEIPNPEDSTARVERSTPAPSSTGTTTTTTSSSSSSTSDSERTSSGSSGSTSRRGGVRRGGTSRGGQNTKRVSRPGKK